MRPFLLTIALLAAIAQPALAGQTRTIRFVVPGMTSCPSCPYIVKSVLARVAGVEKVETIFETGIATVVYDDASVTPDDLRKSLLDYGYDAKPLAPQG